MIRSTSCSTTLKTYLNWPRSRPYLLLNRPAAGCQDRRNNWGCFSIHKMTINSDGEKLANVYLTHTILVFLHEPYWDLWCFWVYWVAKPLLFSFAVVSQTQYLRRFALAFLYSVVKNFHPPWVQMTLLNPVIQISFYELKGQRPGRIPVFWFKSNIQVELWLFNDLIQNASAAGTENLFRNSTSLKCLNQFIDCFLSARYDKINFWIKACGLIRTVFSRWKPVCH